MKKKGLIIVMLSALAAMASTSVQAQRGQAMGWTSRAMDDPDDRIEMRIAFLKHRLDLSGEQTAEVERVLTERYEQAAAWMEENLDLGYADREAFRKQHEEGTAAAIESVLDEEQAATFRGFRERRKDRGAMRQARREVFLQSLDLTEEQREHWESMRSSHRSAMRLWREQNPDASREEIEAFRNAMRESGRAALEKTLTDDQRQKLYEHHRSRGGAGRGQRGRGHGSGSRGGQGGPYGRGKDLL
jgi:hypothetical protein